MRVAGRSLLNRLEKFEAEKAGFTDYILAQNPGGDWGSFVGDGGGGGGRRSGESKVDDLVGTEQLFSRYTGPRGTDIHGLGKLDKIHS